MIADRRICRTADNRPCEADDPQAAWLVVGGPGQTIPSQLVKQLGLRLENKKVVWDEPAAAPAAPTDVEPSSDDEDDADVEAVLPDGYKLDHHGSGYYTLMTPDGVLMENDEPVRVRGKQAAMELFAEYIRGAQEE